MQLIVYWSGTLPLNIISRCRTLLDQTSKNSHNRIWIVVDEERNPLILRPKVLELSGNRNEQSLKWWGPQNGGSHYTAKGTCLSIKRNNPEATLLFPNLNTMDWIIDEPERQKYLRTMLNEMNSEVYPWLEVLEEYSYNPYIALDLSELVEKYFEPDLLSRQQPMLVAN